MKYNYLLFVVFYFSCNDLGKMRNQPVVETDDTVSFLFKISNGNNMRFDDSFQPSGNIPLRIVSGRGDVISGIDSAILGHSIGDTIRTNIIPEQGYGKEGMYYISLSSDSIWVIPTNDTLKLEAIILSIWKAKRD